VRSFSCAFAINEATASSQRPKWSRVMAPLLAGRFPYLWGNPRRGLSRAPLTWRPKTERPKPGTPAI